MAKAIDYSVQFKSQPTPSGSHAFIGGTTQSPIVAQGEGQNVDRCVQDIDPSHASAASHLGDCNLECCTCAARWSARRNLVDREA
jgi:hypothetical protein